MAKKKAETVVDTGADQQPNELAAVRAQMDQLLDIVTEQQQTIETLRAAQTGTSAKALEQDDEQAKLDAELAQLLQEHADYPGIEVFERRVVEGVAASGDIRLKGETPVSEDPQGEQRYWHLRWFNGTKEGRLQQALQEGYVKVQWDELQSREMVVSEDKTDGFVRKGDRGQEVLHKIPRKLYAYKKRRDAMLRDGLLSSKSKLQDYLADSTAAAAGNMGHNADEAGSFVHRGIDLQISEGQRERITL